jgi:uncharacterized protein (DUF736 family)
LGPRPYRPFAGGSRATIRSLRSPTFTRNGSFAIFFPCRQTAAFLARQQDRSARHPPLTLQAKAAGRSLRRSKIAIKAAMVAGLKQQQEITMAQIGTFTRAEDGSYTGTIKTLLLNIKVRFLPTEPSDNEKAPDLRVMAGNVEIGAAWQRTSKENTVYHSVKLDDPSFPAPIYANLVAVDDGYALVWSR